MSAQLPVLVVTIVGLYFAHSLRRRTAAEVSTRRLDAYGALWAITEEAAATRLTDPGGRGPLTLAERRELFDRLTHWYYSDGQGMLLPALTRDLYFAAKDNLVCAMADLRPALVADSVVTAHNSERQRGAISIRQLSLLRSMTRFDVGQFSSPYFAGLGDLDCALLKHCGVDLTRRPWRRFAPVRERGARWRALLPRQRRPRSGARPRRSPTGIGPYRVVGYFLARPGRRREFAEMVLKDARLSLLGEHGTLRFELIQDESHPDRFLLNEAYTDAAAFAKHQDGDPFKEFARRVGNLASKDLDPPQTLRGRVVRETGGL